ncbi:MAG: hypothetical protein ACYCTV_03805, partial [Leptospirales bacterium]
SSSQILYLDEESTTSTTGNIVKYAAPSYASPTTIVNYSTKALLATTVDVPPQCLSGVRHHRKSLVQCIKQYRFRMQYLFVYL